MESISDLNSKDINIVIGGHIGNFLLSPVPLLPNKIVMPFYAVGFSIGLTVRVAEAIDYFRRCEISYDVSGKDEL